MANPFPSILDHLTIFVRDYEKAKAFYTRALAPLGITLAREYGKAGGFGRNGKPELWIGQGKASFHEPKHAELITPIHVAVRAASREEVDAFHREALAAGGRDFGPPGVRAHYHQGYYGAFVLDPDGHNLEAVHHTFG
jgi:catechol 2,3-dioxygenase-like lactoylglutathione lyase family enzyme